MVKYISFGDFNKKYFFILGSIIVNFILTFISGFTPKLTPNKTYYLLGFKSNFFCHPLLSYCFQYFSIGIGGIILHFIFKEKKSDKNRDSVNSNIEKDNNNSSMAVFYKDESLLKNNEIFNANHDKKYYFLLFYTCSIFFLAKIIIKSFDSLGFNGIKYWPLEFIFLLIFAKKILHKNIYIHQKVVLIIIIFLCTLIHFIDSFIPLTNNNCDNILANEEKKQCELLNYNIYESTYHKLGIFFVVIIIILYFLSMIGNAYTSIKNKWLMDFKYITLFKILIFIGFIGFIFSLITFFIFSNISCQKDKKFIEYSCQFENDGELFYDNYRNLKDIVINKEFYLDLFIILPIFLITSFLNTFFELLIIINLDPFYLIPIDCLYFLFHDIIDFIITYNITNKYRNYKFINMILSNFISIFFCMIYFEIIELHFCGFDRYIKKNIIKRTVSDKDMILLKEFNNEDKEDNEDN